MKAVVIEGFSKPITIQQIPLPQPRADEVLVKLTASALNHHDLWMLQEFDETVTYPIILGAIGGVNYTSDN